MRELDCVYIRLDIDVCDAELSLVGTLNREPKPPEFQQSLSEAMGADLVRNSGPQQSRKNAALNGGASLDDQVQSAGEYELSTRIDDGFRCLDRSSSQYAEPDGGRGHLRQGRDRESSQPLAKPSHSIYR